MLTRRDGSPGRPRRGGPRTWRRMLVGLSGVAVAITAVLAATPAGAHPLGNFTINRYARVEVSAGTVRVYYVFDAAELPALQLADEVEADRAGFLEDRVADIARGLELTIDGRAAELTPIGSSLDRPEGQADLRTLRVGAIFTARIDAGPAGATHRLSFRDTNDPDRVGWREVVALARGDAEIERSDVPREGISDALRDYPGDRLSSPLDRRSASLVFSDGTEAVPPAPVPEAAPPPERSGGTFASLVTRRDLGPVALISTFALALAIGAGHALLPGHGKTVMGAYLVGTRGRPVDAVFLGVIVSLMHTASVLVLGLVLFRVSASTDLEPVYPGLTVASGALAMALGTWLLVYRWRAMRKARAAHEDAHAHHLEHDHTHPVEAGEHHEHDHERHHHDHEHEHTHDHDHGHGDDHEHGHVGVMAHHGPGGHTHELPTDVAPLSRRGLVVLATSGGIVPSPTAVVVLVSAFSLGRTGFGLSLIAAFSVGLAATLTVIGLSLVFGRNVVEHRLSERALAALPLIGATALIGLGLVLAGRGVLQLG